MKEKHTPGPWNIDENFAAFDGEEFMSIEYQGCPICTVRGTNDMACIEDDEQEKIAEECMANAKLIAAAPELLDALVHLTNAVPNDGTWNYPAAMEAALKAIKKATE